MLTRWTVYLAGALLAALPRGLLLAAGALLGWFWFYVVPIRRRWTLAHLAEAGVGATALERRHIARAVFVEQARNTLEVLAWARLRRARGQVDWVRVEGAEHLARAREAGRGAVVLTAHVGNFDLMAMHQGLALGGIAIVSKRLSWSSLNDVWMTTRRRCGVDALPSDRVMAAATERLRAGGVVALVLDQHSPERRAVEAPFLGIPCRTSPALATLALRTKAPIVPCFIVREPDGGHRIRFEPALAAVEGRSVRDGVSETTVRCLAVIERVVQAQPSAWLWLHRRWKDAAGEPLVKPRRG